MPRAPLAALAAVPLLLAGCSTHVTMPPDDASPEQVVKSYVDAVNARDCRTAKKLYPDAGRWCGKARLDDLVVDATSSETREGDPAQRVEHVSVTVTLTGGDASMPDGRHGWGYLLAPDGPNGAWRIFDEGVG